jgi:hypothetical protein
LKGVVLKACRGWLSLQEGWAGLTAELWREYGASKRRFFIQWMKAHLSSWSAATDATHICMSGSEETFAYKGIQTAVASSREWQWQRSSFSIWVGFAGMISDDENITSDVSFSDETTFHMSGNCHIWGQQNPGNSVKLQRDSQRWICFVHWVCWASGCGHRTWCMWSGYKITGLIFLPTPWGLGNSERGGILACPLLSINPTTSKAIRPTVW